MLHFTSFCKAAKLTWVKKLYTSAETNGWILVAKEIFKEKHIPFIFEGNTTKIKSKAKEIQNLFWKEVLNSLAFYREQIEVLTEEESSPHAVIWSSGLIQNNNLLIKRNIYMSSGLMYLSDLYNFDTKNLRQESNGQIYIIQILAHLTICA